MNIQKAIKIIPDSVEIHLNLGNMLVILEQFTEANTHYELALKLKPNDVDVFFFWVEFVREGSPFNLLFLLFINNP